MIALALSRSSSDLVGDKLEKGKGVENANAAAVDAQATVSGVKLAHFDITATHAVEFWEVQPGNVMMLQTLDEAKHDAALDLGAQLSDAGGTFSALYRKLMNDEHAALP